MKTTKKHNKKTGEFLEILEERFLEEKEQKERSQQVLLERFKSALDGKELILKNCCR